MQREKIKIEGDMRLPTADMKVHRWDNMTNFYLDEGQLHWPHGDCETVSALYIEAGGDAMVVCAEKLEEVWKIAINLCVSMQVFDREKPWLNGAADFIACRHPSHAARVEMIAKLAGVA